MSIRPLPCHSLGSCFPSHFPGSASASACSPFSLPVPRRQLGEEGDGVLAPRPDTVTGTATWCLRAGLVPRRCSVHLAEQMEALSELREHRLGRRGEPLGLRGKERPQQRGGLQRRASAAPHPHRAPSFGGWPRHPLPSGPLRGAPLHLPAQKPGVKFCEAHFSGPHL